MLREREQHRARPGRPAGVASATAYARMVALAASARPSASGAHGCCGRGPDLVVLIAAKR